MDMYERKQQVVEQAHQLFIDKGYRATSIQDILTISGISKGTFYNYFSSKSELLKAVFLSIQKKFEKERNELLIGQNLADFSIFIKQIELRMEVHYQSRFFTLVEEVMFSNDADLKQFIKTNKLTYIDWLYERFIDLFGEEKKPYLLDCAILFSGMLHYEFHYHASSNIERKPNEIIAYCLDRTKTLVEDVSTAGIQFIAPNQLKTLLPDSETAEKKLLHTLTMLKSKALKLKNEEREKSIQLIDFIKEEITSTTPRFFLIKSTLATLQHSSELVKESTLIEEILEERGRFR